jgi:hypothetical protein
MNKIILLAITPFVISFGVLSLTLASPAAAEGPAVKMLNQIPFVSGGVGIDEREALRTMTKADNLALSFALQNKEYLGGANVVIKDQHGKAVLQTASDGPLFFAKLPAGTYTIEATALGRTLAQTADVPAQGQMTLHFTWTESDRQP